jgi:hypothetical protein
MDWRKRERKRSQVGKIKKRDFWVSKRDPKGNDNGSACLPPNADSILSSFPRLFGGIALHDYDELTKCNLPVFLVIAATRVARRHGHGSFFQKQHKQG